MGSYDLLTILRLLIPDTSPETQMLLEGPHPSPSSPVLTQPGGR